MSIPTDGGRNKPRVYSSPPPDWLKADRPGSDTRPGQTPDWLKVQPGSGQVAPAQPPDWLSKLIAASEPPPAAPAPVQSAPSAPAAPADSLDSLRPAAPDVDSLDALRPAAAEDDLFAALRAETTPPPVAELPDWMGGAADQPKTDDRPMPDWMAEAEQQSKPAEPSTPDWLVEAENQPNAADRPMPDWMVEADDQAKAAPAGEMPDWMASLGEDKPAETAAPEWKAEAKPEAAAPAELPDWMASLDEDKPAALSPAAPEPKAEPKPEAAAPADMPDWMASLSGEDKPAEPAAAAPEPAPAAPDQGEMPDWMTSLSGDDQPGEPPSGLPQTATYKPPPAIPDLMAAADAALPGQEETSLPDWLAASGTSGLRPGESAPPAPAKTPGKGGLLGRLGGDAEAAAGPSGLGGDEPARPNAPALGDSPDWLADLEKVEDELTPHEEPPSATPDWLGGLSGEAPADLPPAPDTVSAGDAPDWLDQVMKDGPAPADTPAPAEPAPAGDWLDGLGAPDAPKPDAAAPVEMPDWLGQIGKPEAETKPPEPAETSAAPEEPAKPAAEASLESPDWLDELAKADAAPKPPDQRAEAPAAPAGESAPAETPAAPAPAAMPDWLGQVAKTHERTSGETPPAPAAPTDSPDWLDQIGKTAAKQETAEPPAEPAATPSPESPAQADLPDWLTQLAATDSGPAPAPSTPPAAPAGPVDTPDWLDQLAAGETPAPAPTPAAGTPPAAPPAPASASDDLSDLLSGMDLGVATAGAGAGEDLLGLSGDLAPTPSADAEAQEAEVPAPEDLPNWLSTMKAAPDQPEAGAAQEPSIPAESLGELDDLRFDKLMGTEEAPPAPSPEKVGALKDVVGTIRPELVFDAQTLKANQAAIQMTLSPEQSRRVEMLQDLLAHKTEDVVSAGPGRRALPVTRWVVAALLIVAVAAPIVLKFSLLSAPSPASTGPADARDMLSNLSGTSRIVVAFDYEPDTSPELDPLALALLSKIAGQTGASVYAVSTRATGPALAQRAIDATLAQAGQDQRDHWLNLGYIPGGPNGITTLVVGSPPGLPSALSVNALGGPSGLTEASLTELKPALIIVVTASSEDLQAWVEQAGRPTGIPMIAATSVGNMPMAAPYRQSRQVSALLSGVNDAVAFRALTGQPSDPALNVIWNTQAVGALVAALAILIGGAVVGLIALRNHPEQGS